MLLAARGHAPACGAELAAETAFAADEWGGKAQGEERGGGVREEGRDGVG